MPSDDSMIRFERKVNDRKIAIWVRYSRSRVSQERSVTVLIYTVCASSTRGTLFESDVSTVKRLFTVIGSRLAFVETCDIKGKGEKARCRISRL